VWEVHHFYPTSNEKLTTYNSVPYKKYKSYFPNIASGALDPKKQLKPLITWEAYAQGVYGEIGFDFPTPFGDVGVEGGVEGQLGKIEGAIGSGYRTGSVSGVDADNLNLGGGASLIVGGEYRRKLDIHDGKFLNEDQIKVGFPAGIETDINSFNKTGSVQIGVPEFKLALGLGFSVGAYMSLNSQLKLTDFEKKLVDAFKNNASSNAETKIEKLKPHP
jgi:hypothetical protein